MASVVTAVVPAVALLIAGCSLDSLPTPTPNGPDTPDDALPAACNPLRTAGACLLPFPSSAFLDDDPSTETKLRVHLGGDVMPTNMNGKTYDAALLNRADGFSPSAQILAYFPERLDASTLPPETAPDRSLAMESATVLLDMTTGERVAHFAELDAQILRDDDRQALILRPMKRLANAHRYAVAITKRVHTMSGGLPTAPVGFVAALAGKSSSARGLAAMQRTGEIAEALAKVGVARDDLLLAWDFTTASDAGLTSTMRTVRERTLAALDKGGLGYTITSVEDDFTPHVFRRVRGTFQVPKFLTSTKIDVAESRLAVDAEGKPVASGTYDAPFTVIIPRAATAAAKAKLVQYGHGFLGSGEGELGDESGSYTQVLGDAKDLAFIATDWIGLSKYEGIDAKGSGAAGLAIGDLNDLVWITDRLHQALANQLVLTRTAHAIAADPMLQINGASVLDDARIDYLGISLGGLMGSALLGFSPDLERGAFNVGAAGWSTLLQRSTNWSLFKIILDGAYPEKLDQQVLIDVLQAHFDPVDGMSIAPHLLADPLPGNGKKHVMLQMAVADVQVSNLASESYARTLGLPLLDEAPLEVWGMTRDKGPLDSGFTAFDMHEEAPPLGNVSAPATTSNHVHTEMRTLPAAEDQIDHFLRTGVVTPVCKGPCDPE
jgi:hypothetical protein